MSETTDRAALIAEAAEYEGYCYFCGDLMPNLAAALADAEIELAVARAIVNESIRGDRAIRQKMDDAEQKIAEQAETIARIHAMATEDTGMAWWVHQELARILTQTDAARA